MFKVEDNQLVWGDCHYYIPEALQDKEVTDIYGTSTAGMECRRGLFKSTNGRSCSVITSQGSLSGFLVGPEPNPGAIIFIREQIDPANTDKTFFLISLKELDSQINWINIKFGDGTLFRLCPFSLQYYIEN